MTATLSTRRLCDLVTESPRRAALFDRLGLDFCCHGQRTLGEACRDVARPLQSVLEAISSADAGGDGAVAVPATRAGNRSNWPTPPGWPTTSWPATTPTSDKRCPPS